MATENIKAMIAEIARMQEWCLENYDKGADTMVECWTTADYENLFYEDARVRQELALYGLRDDVTEESRVRCTFAEAWDLLRRLAAVYADRQADARNSAF